MHQCLNRSFAQSLANRETRQMAAQISSKFWRFLIIIVLVLGIFFRFANLDRKPYWWDEVTNSIHSAGYGKKEFFTQVKTWRNQDLAIADLHRYQFPNSETSSWDVVKVLARGEPQSPPVYYLLSRWWTQLWGSTITVQRSLSALISLLAFPSMYWLCRELFKSPIAAEVGVMLLAVSPFHLLFAQEVRIYSTWSVTILVATAALLRAIRLKRIRDWAIYSASLALSFYTFPLSALVAIAHGIYMAITEFAYLFTNSSKDNKQKSGLIFKFKSFRLKISRIFANYLIASTISVIAFAPWLYCITQVNEQKMAGWRQATLPLIDLVKYWLLQTGLIFADLNPNYRGGSGGGDSSLTSFSDPRSFLPTIFIWSLLIYAFYFLIRRASPKIWLLILSLILVPALTLSLPDLIFGGIRSTVTRYLIPSYLGIQLAVTNLIYQKISTPAPKKIWQFSLAILLSVGIISCGVIINSPSWWLKSINSQNIAIAELINRSTKSIVITPEKSSVHLVSISHNLNSEVKVRFVDQPEIRKLDETFGDHFLLNYPQKWLDAIKKEDNWTLKKIYQGSVVKDPNSGMNFNLIKVIEKD